ncbi:nucleoside 2-deoxyribosyltransferase [Citreimonas salinaria]|uniref:Nucleoside 2-deoxyribosyltransferase n=1 Tax=Citreimonas salinaria TaxID=321339 RepID=A0A1H3IQE6_9RHOB|nr:nucleoside 2-deoxyribosyltransferase [Citreimonas salinaria]SDY29535.1 Nucleoside 2-deoxyribosyltransferase [Citreimonas salinaria]
MRKNLHHHYSRCFISAPYGMDLGVLPTLLGERNIAWNWSEDAPAGTGYAPTIQRCDFVVAVLDGTQNDQRVLYEVGLAEGLNKPVFAIAISKRVGKVARSLFSFVDTKLSEGAALSFHLDAFLSTPHETVFERDRRSFSSRVFEPEEPTVPAQQFHSQLEARVYATITDVGGSAIAEPKNGDSRIRPDLLMWLGSQDAELFDPAVIEIKGQLLDASAAKRAEKQLLDFMQVSGVRCGFLLSENEPPPKRRQMSPYVFWMSVEKFIALAQNGNLGRHVRGLRNRAAHGSA